MFDRLDWTGLCNLNLDLFWGLGYFELKKEMIIFSQKVKFPRPDFLMSFNKFCWMSGQSKWIEWSHSGEFQGKKIAMCGSTLIWDILSYLSLKESRLWRLAGRQAGGQPLVWHNSGLFYLCSRSSVKSAYGRESTSEHERARENTKDWVTWQF